MAGSDHFLAGHFSHFQMFLMQLHYASKKPPNKPTKKSDHRFWSRRIVKHILICPRREQSQRKYTFYFSDQIFNFFAAERGDNKFLAIGRTYCPPQKIAVMSLQTWAPHSWSWFRPSWNLFPQHLTPPQFLFILSLAIKKIFFFPYTW